MTDPPEDGDRPAQPAYGSFGGHPPAPPSGPPPQGQPQYGGPPYAPPPYAQPQYVPYAPQPDSPGYGAPVERRRTGPRWALAAVVVVAVAIAVVLSFTLRTRVLDRSAVERDVATQFEEHEGVAVRLDCADPMALSAGATYRCQGTTADGEQVTLLIQVTDAQRARYTWSERR